MEDFDPTEPEGDWPFREVVGSLMWLANQTRLDIANAVRAVARYCHVPKSVHWKAVLHIVRYLKSTSQFELLFNEVVVFNLRCSRIQIL